MILTPVQKENVLLEIRKIEEYIIDNTSIRDVCTNIKKESDDLLKY